MYEQGEYLDTGMGWGVNGKTRQRNSVHIVGATAVFVDAKFAYLVSSSDLHVCRMANIFTINVNNMPARHSTLGRTSYIALHLLLCYIP